MLLDTYSLLGKEKFLQSTKSAKDALNMYLTSIVRKDTNQLYQSLSLLQTFPVADVKDDLNFLMFELTKKLLSPTDDTESKLAKALGNNLFKIIKTYTSDWFRNSFDNDVQMQTALLALFQLLGGSSSPESTQPSKVRGK